MAGTEMTLADHFWDLRDDAYDHPERWKGLTPVDVFQLIAECVQATEDRGGKLDLHRDVAARLSVWRSEDSPS